VIIAPPGGHSHGTARSCVPFAVSRRLDGYFPKDPPARIAIQVAGANAQPGRNAHFALDVIALDPEKS